MSLLLSMAFAASDFYQIQVKDIDSKPVKMSQYQGKVLLIVNTASECGYTKQYAPLEELYQKYKDKNFLVLGFPSNDFGGQEPGSEKEIKSFCQTKFNVTFPLFSKVTVSPKNQHPLFTHLTSQSKGVEKGPVKWNFEKFLVNKKGEIVKRYSSQTQPLDPQVIKDIETLL